MISSFLLHQHFTVIPSPFQRRFDFQSTGKEYIISYVYTFYFCCKYALFSVTTNITLIYNKNALCTIYHWNNIKLIVTSRQIKLWRHQAHNWKITPTITPRLHTQSHPNLPNGAMWHKVYIWPVTSDLDSNILTLLGAMWKI